MYSMNSFHGKARHELSVLPKHSPSYLKSKPNKKALGFIFHRFLLIVTFLVYLVCCQSCYYYQTRVRVPKNDPGIVRTDVRKMRVCHYFWGILKYPSGDNGVIIAKECAHSNAINDFRVTTTIRDAFITILTLGLVSPIEIEWHCQAVRQIEATPTRKTPRNILQRSCIL